MPVLLILRLFCCSCGRGIGVVAFVVVGFVVVVFVVIVVVFVVIVVVVMMVVVMFVVEKQGNGGGQFMTLRPEVIVLSVPKNVPDRLLAQASIGRNGPMV